MGYKRIHTVGDLVAFKLPSRPGYGLALLAAYKRARSIYDECGLWYGFDLHFPKVPSIGSVPSLTHANVTFVNVFNSPVQDPPCTPIIGTLPDFHPSRWPLPVFGGRGYASDGWNDGRYLDVQESFEGPVARIHGRFGLTPAQYRRLPLRRASSANEKIATLLERGMDARYPARLRMTSKTAAFWAHIIARAKTLGYLDPMPKPRRPRLWKPPEFGSGPRTFWALIERAAEVSEGNRKRFLHAVLHYFKTSAGPERVQMRRDFRQAMKAAHRWDLWGAAYILNDGCSDDGFIYFRAWLMTKGQECFEKALRDPDSLATTPLRFQTGSDGFEFEEFIEAIAATADWMWADRVGGEKWDIEDADERRKRLPRLTAAYPSETDDRKPRKSSERENEVLSAESLELLTAPPPGKVDKGKVFALFNLVGPFEHRVIREQDKDSGRRRGR